LEESGDALDASEYQGEDYVIKRKPRAVNGRVAVADHCLGNASVLSATGSTVTHQHQELNDCPGWDLETEPLETAFMLDGR
jgi:hypothetical protein